MRGHYFIGAVSSQCLQTTSATKRLSGLSRSSPESDRRAGTAALPMESRDLHAALDNGDNPCEGEGSSICWSALKTLSTLSAVARNSTPLVVITSKLSPVQASSPPVAERKCSSNLERTSSFERSCKYPRPTCSKSSPITRTSSGAARTECRLPSSRAAATPRSRSSPRNSARRHCSRARRQRLGNDNPRAARSTTPAITAARRPRLTRSGPSPRAPGRP